MWRCKVHVGGDRKTRADGAGQHLHLESTNLTDARLLIVASNAQPGSPVPSTHRDLEHRLTIGQTHFGGAA